MKIKKRIIVPLLVIVCIVLGVVFVRPAIEMHTWVLTSAQQANPPHFVVAHKSDYDISDNDSNIFSFSKSIELTCAMRGGKLTLTDKTNGKTYEGTYRITSWNRFQGQCYSVVIDGQKGSANIATTFPRTLFVSVGDYYLNFEPQ